MLTLTETAADRIKQIIAAEGKGDDTYVRVGVRGGGCSGFNYELFLDSGELKDMDEEFENFGVKMVCNQICLAYLDGTEVDFVEAMFGGGFTFNNPNATSTCGCAQSFSVE